MSRWAKTTIVAFVMIAIIGAGAFLTRSDPFGEAIKPIWFALTLGLQVLALFSAWLWGRIASKRFGTPLLAAVFGISLATVALVVFLLIINHRWSLDGFGMFALFPAIASGVPLTYFIVVSRRSNTASHADSA